MTPITRTLRSGSLAAAATLSLLVVTAPAALADGGDAEIEEVDYECTSIDVTASKSISNVVLEFADGDTQRFEDLPESETGTFAGTGENSGEVITTAWIKSGNNKSEEGPGYGEEFEFDTSTCADDSAGDGEDEGDSATGGSAGEDDDDATGGSDGDDGDDDSDTGGSDGEGDDGGDDDDSATGSENDSDTGETTTDTGDSTTDNTTDSGTDSTTGTDEGAVETTNDDTTDTDDDTVDTQVESIQEVADDTDDTGDEGIPSDEVAVLGETEEREVNAAADTDVRAADTLPNTGAGALPTLLAALATLGLGTGLVRRGRND